ncbi:phage portal protein [Proteus mirabilis]|uniref:Phage portal protein n=1 Tax=Proteus mirabilis TaxID=584 RepID=A0A379GJM8_PROMI|nr:phage portal protein [Proteus mirabilis]
MEAMPDLFYTFSGCLIKQSDINKIRNAMKDSKGPGNFRNLFIHVPNGRKDSVQVIPAAKDEFLNINNVSRDDC